MGESFRGRGRGLVGGQLNGGRGRAEVGRAVEGGGELGMWRAVFGGQLWMEGRAVVDRQLRREG